MVLLTQQQIGTDLMKLTLHKDTNFSELHTFSHNFLKLLFNPFQPSVAFLIEISHLVWGTNLMTCFYTKCNTRLAL